MNNKISLFLFIWAAFAVTAGAQIIDEKPKVASEQPIVDVINDSYSYDYFFPFDDQDTLHLTVEQKKVQLEKNYKRVQKSLKSVKDKQRRAYYAHVNDLAHLNLAIRLAKRGSDERNALLAKIDPNDSVGLLCYLPQRFIDSKLTGNYDEAWGHDLTDYGLEYMARMKEHITNSKVKHALLDNCAHETLDYGKDYADIDRFWKPFCEYAGNDTTLINNYQFKVDALKTTKRGIMAPDFAFTDSLGNVHRLSDYRGKVVYIDCWATWCGPCCKEIPFLEKHVSEFKDDTRVQFISISMDSNRNAWLKKIRKDCPAWPQMNVSKEQDEALSKAYGITGIPRFLLFNADGTIADANAFRPSDTDFSAQLKKVIGQ